jgi:hypothetical protein
MYQIGRSCQTALALPSALKSLTCPRSVAFCEVGKFPYHRSDLELIWKDRCQDACAVHPESNGES